MQPRKLKINAFGPYAGEEIINFNELKNNKLFLISGPTGSGKTTIFDAMSFALYGEANGEQRSTEDLRSQFVGPDTLTRVSLEFTVKGVDYEILREPTQEREKKVGEGLTTHSAYAELKIYNRTPAEVITGVLDVTNRIIEIIGLDSQQFKQIMMIPQGEFRKLLVSDSQEREKILQKLFDTRIYKEIQEALKAKERDQKKVWNSLKISQREAINRISNDLNDEKLETILSRDHVNIEELILRLSEINKQDKEEINEIKNIIKTCEEQITKLIEEKTMGIELNKKILQLNKTKEALKMLSSEEKQVFEYKEELKNILAVKEVKPFKDMLDKVTNEVKKKKLVKNENEELLRKSNERFGKVQAVYKLQNSSEQEELREQLNKDLINYKNALEKVKNLESIKEKIAAIKKDLEKNKNEKSRSNNLIEKLKGEIFKSEERIITLENAFDIGEISEKLQQLNAEKMILNQINDFKSDIDEVKERKNILEKEMKEQEKVKTEKERTYKKGKLLYHQNQAAILAKDLDSGEACPVCGSYEHPNLAQFISETIDQKRLDILEKNNAKEKIKYEAIKKDYLQLPEKIKDFKEKIEKLASELKNINKDFSICEGSKKIKVVINTIEILKDKKVRANKNKEEIQKLKKLIIEDRKKLETIMKENKTLEEAIQLKERKLTGLISTRDSIKSDIPKAMESLEELQSLIAKLENKKKLEKAALEKSIKDYNDEKVKIEKLNSIIELTSKDIRELNREKVVAKEEFEKALISKSISENVFNKYLEKIEKIDFYESQITEYNLEKEKLSNELKRLNQVIGKSSSVSIESIDKRILNITKEKEDALQKKEIYNSRVKTNESELSKVVKLKNKIEIIEDDYKILGDLSDVANGKNEHRMTFERYVLAAFLENIIDAANTRLTKMTSGRYEMSRTAKKERANKQSGLEIEVFDNYTGKERHVKTLSGGESFMASLAMALGLSDVVQSYAGNVRLDTMFIDEGFGTLDPDALDAAINCLIDLQDSGRLVGLISHVPELKERIEARLEVSTTNIGSTTKFIVL